MSAVRPLAVTVDPDDGSDEVLVREAWRLEDLAAAALGDEDLAAPPQHAARDAARADRIRLAARRRPEESGAARALADADRVLWRLVGRYDARIAGQVRRLTRRGAADPDDVRSEVRLLWWRAALAWDPGRGTRFSTWGWGWAKRACRGRKLPELRADDLRPGGSNPFDGVDLGLDLRAAIAACPMSDRERLVFDALFGPDAVDSVEVAAERLGMGRATVRARRDAVVRRLRARMEVTR